MSIYLHKVKSRWQPGENTVAYYPLNSTSTVNDMKVSGTKYNLTNYNILFGTYQGVDCAYFNSANSRSGLYYSGTQIIPSGDFTWNVWMYLINTSTDNPRLCSSYAGGNNYGILLNSSGNIVVWSTSSTTGIPTTTGGWHLYTVVGNFSQGSYKGYVDGVLSNTWSGTGISSGTGLNIGGFDSAGSGSATSDKLNGYLSERILENKKWSDNDVMDYYMLTKGDYYTETPWEVNEHTVAYYPFKEDILDHSGNNKDFTGSGYSFDNNMITTTSVLTGPVVTPENTTGDRTINIWCNRNNAEGYSFRGSNSGTDGYLNAKDSENGNRPGASFKTSSWYRNRPSASDLPTMGDMILMTRIKTGATMKLYINGVLTSTTTLNTETRSSTYGITKSSLALGTFGEIVIEDKVRSADEVLSYYYQTRNNYIDDPWYPVKEYEVQNIYIGDATVDPKSLLSDIIVYYPMQGNLNDDGPNGWNISTDSGSYTGTDYLTFTNFKGRNASGTYSTSSSITCSTWCNGATGQLFVLGSDSYSGWGAVLGSDGMSIVVSSTMYGAGVSAQSGWFMSTGVFDYTNHILKAYVNGELVGTTNVGNGGLRGGVYIGMGANSNFASNTEINGNMGITFATQNAMTQEQIKAFYDASKKLYGL